LTLPPGDSHDAGTTRWSPEQQQAYAWREVYSQTDVTSLVQQHRLRLALEWIDSLGLPEEWSALDAGCGAGAMAIEMSRRGAVVSAVDISIPMLIEARSWSGEGAARRRVSFGAGDVQALPFRDESFRLVVALGVVPWASHPRAALLEMGRVLEPEGFLVVSATNRWSLIRLLDPHPLRNPLLDPIRRLAEALLPAVVTPRRERITIHSLEGFDRLLRATALEPLRSRSYGFGPLTLFRRPLLPERMAVSVHRRLQTLADHDIPGLRSLGSQYLVLCKKQRPRSPS
jgi:ubiquinone/menaquinone biosynthesis C-methylase UbiE